MKLRAAVVCICVGLSLSLACRDADDGSTTAGTLGSRGNDGTTSSTGDGNGASLESTGEMCEILEPGEGRAICYEAAALAPNCGECFTQWHIDFCTGVYESFLDYGPECVVAAESFERCWWNTCETYDGPGDEDHPCYELYLTLEETCWPPDTD